MALKELVMEYIDDIMGGIAWVTIWRVGRTWKAWVFHLDEDGKLDEDDLETAKEILKEDKKAIMINKYYCARMGDGTLADVATGILCHYERGYNLLKDWICPEDGAAAGQQADLNPEQLYLMLKRQTAIAFMGTPAGAVLKEVVYKLEKALEDQDEREVAIQMAAWEVFKLVVKQLTGMEFCFTRTDEYFGLCTEDERCFLVREERYGEVQEE